VRNPYGSVFFKRVDRREVLFVFQRVDHRIRVARE